MQYRAALVIAICIIHCLPAMRIAAKTVANYGLQLVPLERDDWRVIREGATGRYAVIDFVRQQTPPEAVVLVYRQSDFGYYAQRKMIQHVDPRMVPVYQSDTSRQAHRLLREMGVDYVYFPGYALPTYYNTPIADVLGDPDLAEPCFENGGYRLLRLRDPAEHSPATLGSPRTLVDTPLEFGASESPHVRQVNHLSAVDARSWPDSGAEPDPRYVIRGKASGQGAFWIDIVYRTRDRRQQTLQVWHSVLDDSPKRFQSQFVTPPGVKSLSAVFQVGSRGQVRIDEAQLFRVNPPSTPEKSP